jgi:predicted DNA-binding transcriptional regulator AlpA
MTAPVANRTSTRHLGQNDLAQRWGISARTLERWRWIGDGPAFLKIGARVAYRMEDVEAYEAERRRTTQAQAQQALRKGERFARRVPG